MLNQVFLRVIPLAVLLAEPAAGQMDTGFIAQGLGGGNPSDPYIAVGDNHIVAVTNHAFAAFSKEGEFLEHIPISSKLPPPQQGVLFDPVCLWDRFHSRFVIATAEFSTPNLVLAISESDDPTADWHVFRIDISPFTKEVGNADFPNIAITPSELFISTNVVEFATGLDAFTLVFDKMPLLAGTLPTPVDVPCLGNWGMARHYDASSSLQFFVNRLPLDEIGIWAVEDALGAQVCHSTTVTTSIPTTVTQDGNNSIPQLKAPFQGRGFGLRFYKSICYRDGSLWIAHTRRPLMDTTRVIVHWAEIQLNGWPASGTPSIRQEGVLDFGASTATFYPGIAVDADGTAAIVYQRSSSSTLISIERAVRFSGDPLGNFRAPVTLATNGVPHLANRSGDYGCVDVDPIAAGRFWSHHQFRGTCVSISTLGNRTWIGEIDLGDDGLEEGVRLDAPVSGTTSFALPLVLQWTTLPSLGGSVTVEIAEDPAFGNIVHSASTSASEYAVPQGVLCSSIQYFWRATGVGVTTFPRYLSFVNEARPAGDTECDCDVDSADIANILGAWGTDSNGEDFSGDGIVGSADLSIALGNFGQPCPSCP